MTELVIAPPEETTRAPREAEKQPGVVELSRELLASLPDFIRQLKERCDQVAGLDELPVLVDSNIRSQLDLFDAASIKLRNDSVALIPLYGLFRQVSTDQDIVGFIRQIQQDLGTITLALGNKGVDFFTTPEFQLLDKYLFDGKNLEKVSQVPLQIRNFSKAAPLDGILSKTDDLNRDYLPLMAIDETLGTDDIIILEINSDNWADMTWVVNDLDAKIAKDDPGALQPALIVYWNDPKKPDIPLYIKSTFGGAHFATNVVELQAQLALCRELKALKTKPDILKPDTLSIKLQGLYDISSLREWETHTADTQQSLQLLIDLFDTLDHREQLARKRYTKFVFEGNKFIPTGQSDEERIALTRPPGDWRVNNVLDLGTGEGRIAGMLARMGKHVVGMDISQTQLDHGQERLQEEGAGLRGEAENAQLSYNALKRIQAERKFRGLPPLTIDLDDAQTASRYVTFQGSFHTLFKTLNDFVLEWRNNPGAKGDIREFLTTSEYAFEDTRDQFADASFDMVTLNWHTFCEVGDPENQKWFLRDLMRVMSLGATGVIEIMDRNVGPYAGALSEYHKTHPTVPYGTIEDTTSTNEGEASKDDRNMNTARYFPDRTELVTLLRGIGFEIDPEKDIKTYLIRHKDPVTGKETLQVKELFITFRKPYK